MKIRKYTAWFMALLFLVSACSLDSSSWIPVILCGISGGHLVRFAYAHDEQLEERRAA